MAPIMITYMYQMFVDELEEDDNCMDMARVVNLGCHIIVSTVKGICRASTILIFISSDKRWLNESIDAYSSHFG